MKLKVKQLISIAGPALSAEVPHILEDLHPLTGEAISDLLSMLRQKNGFYVFADTLHVFPAGPTESGFDLTIWNSQKLWRSEYGGMADGYLFFAENLYGDRFALKDDKVYFFDSETAKPKEYATSIEEWAGRLLCNPESEKATPSLLGMLRACIKKSFLGLRTLHDF